MKKFRLLWITCSLFHLSVYAQKSYDYQPFIKEGKVWNVTYLTHEGYSSYKRTYIIQGDTIIEGKQYKKFFDGDRYAYALREDNKKVYAVASTDKFGKPNTKEELWYDFDVNKGDIIDTEVSKMSILKVDTMSVNGVKRKCFHISETSSSDPSGQAVGLWVEGVGSFMSPNKPNGWFYDGSTATMDDCYEDGQCIFTHDDFVAAEGYSNTGKEGTEIQSQKELEENNTNGFIFDLKGQRQNSMSRKGIYIQNRKKIKITW